MRIIYTEAYGASEVDLGFVRVNADLVTAWETDPGLIPAPDMQSALDATLAEAPEAVQVRFALLMDSLFRNPLTEHSTPSNVRELQPVNTR
jgi:hypothetical protein